MCYGSSEKLSLEFPDHPNVKQTLKIRMQGDYKGFCFGLYLVLGGRGAQIPVHEIL